MASPDETWLIDLGDQSPGDPARHRPALVIGPIELFGPSFPFVLVVPLTTTRRGLSLHVEIDAVPATGLADVSYAKYELLRSVSTRRLVHRLGVIGPDIRHDVDRVIRSLLGF